MPDPIISREPSDDGRGEEVTFNGTPTGPRTRSVWGTPPQITGHPDRGTEKKGK